jgi:hypothetical protein
MARSVLFPLSAPAAKVAVFRAFSGIMLKAADLDGMALPGGVYCIDMFASPEYNSRLRLEPLSMLYRP